MKIVGLLQGRRLVHPKFEVGDGPCILRSGVVGCARKYEQSKKKGAIKEYFSEIIIIIIVFQMSGCQTAP